MTTCVEHDWVAKTDLRQIDTHRVEIFPGDDVIVVNVGAVRDEYIVEEYETRLVCVDCDEPYPVPDDVDVEFQ